MHRGNFEHGFQLRGVQLLTQTRSFAALFGQTTALPETSPCRSSRTLHDYSNRNNDDSSVKLTCLTTV